MAQVRDVSCQVDVESVVKSSRGSLNVMVKKLESLYQQTFVPETSRHFYTSMQQ